jgi:hypothetical protein
VVPAKKKGHRSPPIAFEARALAIEAIAVEGTGFRPPGLQFSTGLVSDPGGGFQLGVELAAVD